MITVWICSFAFDFAFPTCILLHFELGFIFVVGGLLGYLGLCWLGVCLFVTCVVDCLTRDSGVTMCCVVWLYLLIFALLLKCLILVMLYG